MAPASPPATFSRSGRTRARLLALAVASALTLGVMACGDDSTSPGEDTVVGTWTVTSFAALGTDLISDGMSLTVTLSQAMTVTFVFQNDQTGFCDPGPNCTDSGAYSVTESALTLDPGTEDETVFAYSLQGNIMTWTGDIDGNAATIRMSRQ